MRRETLARRLTLMRLSLVHIAKPLSKVQLPLLPKRVLLQRLEPGIIRVLRGAILRRAALACKTTLLGLRDSIDTVAKNSAILVRIIRIEGVRISGRAGRDGGIHGLS